jgi:hypothetical protein
MLYQGVREDTNRTILRHSKPDNMAIKGGALFAATQHDNHPDRVRTIFYGRGDTTIGITWKIIGITWKIIGITWLIQWQTTDQATSGSPPRGCIFGDAPGSIG